MLILRLAVLIQFSEKKNYTDLCMQDVCTVAKKHMLYQEIIPTCCVSRLVSEGWGLGK